MLAGAARAGAGAGLHRRLYHSTGPLCSVTKQSRMITRMLNNPKKRKWYDVHDTSMPTVKSLSKTTREPGKKGTKRIAVLNKLFMKNITDLMSTGSLAHEILGRGLEISRVNVTPDFNIVNVFWVCKGSPNDKETEALLNRTAGALRHELSQLRVMGEVPTIMFVKDELQARIVELDRRLAKADFGEDYAPTELGHLLKSEFTLETKLSPEMKAKIKQLENNDDTYDYILPEMTHSVYGLEHDKIMNRLRSCRKISEDAWSKVGTVGVDNTVSYRTSDSADTSPIDYDEQRKNLAEFLQKRQLDQDKFHKRLLDTAAERNVVYQIQDDKEQDYYEDAEFDDLEETYDLDELMEGEEQHR